MKNYYVELDLDRSSSIEELEKKLKALRKTWTSRASIAHELEPRQHAERMVALIREASKILLVKEKKAAYDKELDKDPDASKTSSSSLPQSPADINEGQDTPVTTPLDLAEQFAKNNDYAQAISTAQSAIASGNVSVQLYYLLSACYYDTGNREAAFKTLQDMLRTFNDDFAAHFNFVDFCLNMLPEHLQDTKASLDWMKNSDHGESGDVVALDVQYELIQGNIALADAKINEYLSKNGEDQKFRQEVCQAYSMYADSKATTFGGDIYFDTEQNLDDWIRLYERALEIYQDATAKEAYEINKQLKDRVLLVTNWPGILCGVLYTFGGFATPGATLMGMIALVLTTMIVHTSFVPKWMLIRYEYTHSLKGGFEACRILNIVISIWFRISWEIAKIILKIVSYFFLRG